MKRRRAFLSTINKNKFHMNNGQKILLSFLAGAAAGVVAGLLLAPDSGKEIRKKIAKKASDLKGTLENQIRNLKTKESSS
jgi:gas vesicle protein